MRKLFLCGIVGLSLLIGMQGWVANCFAGDAPATEGAALSALQFPVPVNTQARQYLGVTGGGKFQLGQVPGAVVILEIFSVYCPYCQQEAPQVDALYRAITRHADLKDKVKLVGIGEGNNRYEVDRFKSRYQIPFTLLPDPEFSVGDVIKGLRTPSFVVLKRNDNGSHTVIYSKVGDFGNPQHFLDSLLHKARLKG